jgi:hypothetical protein
VWVCARIVLQVSATDIATALGRWISRHGVEIREATFHLDALNRYKKAKAHSVDLHAATAVAKKVPVVSFDQDVRKFIDVRVETEELRANCRRCSSVRHGLLRAGLDAVHCRWQCVDRLSNLDSGARSLEDYMHRSYTAPAKASGSRPITLS